MFAAGHETTSNALTWTLFLLSQHPRVFANLLDELEETLHGNAPTIEQLGHLPLLDGVVKEERWATLDSSPYEYLPFSAGRHMCAWDALTSVLKIITMDP